MPSGKVVTVGGIFQTSQCNWSSVVRLRETSRSCMCSTKLCVAGGALVHVRAGEIWSPAWVYLGGMTAPSWNAVLVSVIAGAGGPPARCPPPAGACALITTIESAHMSATVRRSCIAFLLLKCPEARTLKPIAFTVRRRRLSQTKEPAAPRSFARHSGLDVDWTTL